MMPAGNLCAFISAPVFESAGADARAAADGHNYYVNRRGTYQPPTPRGFNIPPVEWDAFQRTRRGGYQPPEI